MLKWLFAPKPKLTALEALERQYDFLNDPAIGDAIKEIKRLREALRFYADGQPEADNGRTARAALGENNDTDKI